jgi:xylose isomerase
LPKVGRESFEPVDLFYAHIGGMDAFARGLKIASVDSPRAQRLGSPLNKGHRDIQHARRGFSGQACLVSYPFYILDENFLAAAAEVS